MLIKPFARLAAVWAPGRAVHDHAAGGGLRWCLIVQVGHLLFRGGDDLFQLSQEHFIVGLVVNIMNVNVAEVPIRINNKDGSFAASFFAQDVIFPAYRAVRPEVAQQRVIDAPQTFRPCLQTGDVINADAQNLDIQSRKRFAQRLV